MSIEFGDLAIGMEVEVKNAGVPCRWYGSPVSIGARGRLSGVSDNAITICCVGGVSARAGTIYTEDPYNERTTSSKRYKLSDYVTRVPSPKLASSFKDLRGRWYKSHSVIIGADPEVFAVSAKGNVLSAYTFLPPKDEATDGIFWDGFQCEFTVSPNTCLAYLTDAVQAKLEALAGYVKHAKRGARLTYKSVMPVSKARLQKADDTEASLGCDPSINVYGAYVPPIVNTRDIPFRTAGCHMHIGLVGQMLGTEDQPCWLDVENTVRMMDRVASVTMTAVLDGLSDPVRRQLYGRAGEYRRTKYGIEYRVPGSEVLVHPAMFHLYFDLVRAAYYLACVMSADAWESSDVETVTVINNCDAAQARKILRRNKALVDTVVQAVYSLSNHGAAVNMFWKLVEEGVKNSVSVDLEDNWCLPPAKTGWLSHSGAKNCQYISLAYNGARV